MKKDTVDTFGMSFRSIYKDTRTYVQVTEWANGEGYDISIDDKQTISLHEDEWRAISVCLNAMQLHEVE